MAILPTLLQTLEVKLYGIDDQDVEEVIPKSAWKSCPGSAGTIIFVDTKNVLHHGTVRQKDRSTLFFCYTANPPERPDLCIQFWKDNDIYPDGKVLLSENLHLEPVISK